MVRSDYCARINDATLPELFRKREQVAREGLPRRESVIGPWNKENERVLTVVQVGSNPVLSPSHFLKIMKLCGTSTSPSCPNAT